MKLSFFSKILIIIAFVSLSYLYALYEKQKYFSSEDSSSIALVLKELPTISVYTLDAKKIIIAKNTIGKSSGVFVHVWGTWCAPCEKEMPEFLAYAEKLRAKGIIFYLVAVNDDMNNVKKFLKRFSKIPENVMVVVDQDNRIADLFGTLKVPETFLFNSNGKHVNKFIGPQEWTQASYLSGIDYWLTSKN